MALHPYFLRSCSSSTPKKPHSAPSPSVSNRRRRSSAPKKPHSAPSPSVSQHRRRSARTSSQPLSNMAAQSVDWVMFGQKLKSFPPISEPPTIEDISNIDIARFMIVDAGVTKQLTHEQQAVHISVVDQAFEVGLRTLSEEARKAYIVTPALDGLRAELVTAITNANADVLKEIKQSIARLEASMGRLEKAVAANGVKIAANGTKIANLEEKIDFLRAQTAAGFRGTALSTNMRSGDGSLRPFLPFPFKNDEFPGPEYTPLRCTQDILNLSLKNLNDYLKAYGKNIVTQNKIADGRRQLAATIGVNEQLLPAGYVAAPRGGRAG